MHEKATALLVDAIRTQTDVALKLRRELLRSEEAKAQRELTRVQIAAALAMRERATALRDTWTLRWLITKRKPRVKPPAGATRDE